MTTASDKCAGTHHHQADENLQNNTRNGGGAIDPANTRTGGENILPQLVHAIILRHSSYEQRERINASVIWDIFYEYFAFVMFRAILRAVQQVVTISPGYVTMSYTLYTQFKEIVVAKMKVLSFTFLVIQQTPLTFQNIIFCVLQKHSNNVTLSK